ncbi:phage terminase small subunit P27 family [Ancylobacter vacuolatus]|uniref:P27 family predicted phage terminase small subunit n=1 Tax=Ancylobacter vacuolatus TaxID=223389 RepID=A0ABU0DHG2_9HYPH|nr:phage terminase small subunit P27 family [Ancylobacter vacuolatus]MDQ0347865.1 P27 family predicted phage terminase small subunit [Ancylobacter vacuolatus]
MRGRKPSFVDPGSSPVRGPLDPPEWLSPDARAEWERVAPILIEERRTLTMTDVATLANYCVAVGRAAEAERLITSEGMIYHSKTGPKKHPAVAISSDAQTQARLLAGELGLTPVSRSRPAARGAADSGQDDLFGMDG